MQRSDYKVFAHYLVRGPDRDSTGHPFYFCAGRGWSKNWLEVSVVDGTVDPTEEYVVDEKSGKKATRVILNMVTQAQLDELRADDQNIVVRSIVDGKGESTAENVDVLALIKQNSELNAKVAKLEGENANLAKRLADANNFLEEATKPAKALVDKMGNRPRR